MSGMFESKSDKASRKLARSKSEEKAKRKTRSITISVIVSLILLSAVAIILNSGFIRRAFPAVTIDGVSFTTTEFEFFYNSEYMEFVNEMSQFQGMGPMPDTNRPLSEQEVDLGSETGEPLTWAELFTERALDRLAHQVSVYNIANASGFVLSDEHLATIEEEVEMVAMQAMMNMFPSTDSFLQQLYGSGMNERTYRDVLEFTATVEFYMEHVRESFVYSNEELAGYYNENRDSFDVFRYRQFTVNVEHPAAMDFEDEDEYSEAVLMAIIEASARAAAIAEGIASEEDFIAAAREYNEMLYSEPDSTLWEEHGEWIGGDINSWLLDETRILGDIEVVDTETGSNIVFFVSRDDNNYRTVGMRQLLISREQVSPEDYIEGEAAPAYLEALEEAEREARERAERVNSLFVAAGMTESALIDLMDEHSDDFTEGGLYTNITRHPYQSLRFNTMKVVPEIEDWLFYENRMIGDSELIHTSDFGYHLIYFTGFGEPFFELIADDRMRTRDHNAWLEGLPLSEPVRHFAFILVQV
jgi:hypothetical protein